MAFAWNPLGSIGLVVELFSCALASLVWITPDEEEHLDHSAASVVGASHARRVLPRCLPRGAGALADAFEHAGDRKGSTSGFRAVD